MNAIVLILILIVLAAVVLPVWPYSSGWGYGYYPSGILGLIVAVLIILALLGRL